MRGPDVVAKQFPSSSSDAVYTALLDRETGASSCNCKGWVFKRHGKPRSCKHTKAMLAEHAGALRKVRPVKAEVFEAVQARLEAEVNKLWTRRVELDEAREGKALKPLVPKLDL